MKRQGWLRYEAKAVVMVFRPAEADSGKPHARAGRRADKVRRLKPHQPPSRIQADSPVPAA